MAEVLMSAVHRAKTLMHLYNMLLLCKTIVCLKCDI